jgi:DNA-binding NarL/FixJ family response regulator
MLILIIDNSIQIIERLEEIISETKKISAIHRALSYEDAKILYKKNKYDAVLLDINLPQNKSLKLLKEIKKTGSKTCVIMMFTHMDNYIMEQYKTLGADFFFDKYFDFEKIDWLLDTLC